MAARIAPLVRAVALAAAIAAAIVLLVGGSRAAHAQGLVTKPPKLSHFVEASRPPGVAPDQTATVVLSVDISADGSVSDVRVQTSGGAGWDEAAIAAVKQFT